MDTNDKLPSFDNVVYDVEADVLYLSRGRPLPFTDYSTLKSGHVIRRDEKGNIRGLTIVGLKDAIEFEEG